MKFRIIALDVEGAIKGSHIIDCTNKKAANSECQRLQLNKENNNLKFEAHVAD
jgi:hypothetical protein